jgi:hypothetical protein
VKIAESRRATPRYFAISVFALFVSSTISSADPVKPGTAGDPVDLAVMVPDSGAALDTRGNSLPDTGVYVAPIKEKSEADAATTPAASARNGNGNTKAAGEKAAEKANLKVDSPIGVFTKGRVTRIVSSKTTVKNVSRVPAQGVKIFTRLPSGQRIRMQGPESLAPGELGNYSVEMNQVISVGGNLVAEHFCENCEK